MAKKLIKERLPLIVDQCKTMKEAIDLLGASKQYVYVLTRMMGITKWRRNYKKGHSKIKTVTKICEECGESFTKMVVNHNPNRFCSQKCKGAWMGKRYGFGMHPDHPRRRSKNV